MITRTHTWKLFGSRPPATTAVEEEILLQILSEFPVAPLQCALDRNNIIILFLSISPDRSAHLTMVIIAMAQNIIQV